MKKKSIIILIDTVLYIIFAILYASKGFALKLAEETTTTHLVYDEYGEGYYSYLYFKPISKILYKVGALGVIITGIILIVLLTYVTYREYKSLKTVGEENTCSNEYEKSANDIDKTKVKDNVVKKYGIIIFIALIYALILFLIPIIIEGHFFSEVGTEGVNFELF